MSLEGRRFLEISALCGLGLAQPFFDVVGKSPDFLLFRGADRGDVLILVAAVAFAPPVVVWLGGFAFRIAGNRIRTVSHSASVLVLFALLALVTLKTTTDLRGVPLVVLAALLGLGAVALYTRYPSVGLGLRYASPAPLAFAALFLFVSPTSGLVLPGPEGAARAAKSQAVAPVVMMVFDEFPLVSLLDGDGQVDERLYPNFARLAETTTWFRNATTSSALTQRAVPSLMTGRWPGRSVAPTARQFPDNLFTLFGESHEIRAFESVTALCSDDLCQPAESPLRAETGLGVVLADSGRVMRQILSPNESTDDPVEAWLRDQTVLERLEDVPADARESADLDKMLADGLDYNQPARFRAFTESITSGGRPFYFLHALLPHEPWHYLPDGHQYPTREAAAITDADGERFAEPWPLLHARQRHLFQVMYLDSLLGEVLDRLEETGVFDRSLMVVTADHGFSFVPGPDQPSKTPTPEAADQVLWVPFFIKAPGQTSGVVRDDNAMLIDLVPTIADVLSIDVPWEVDGISLASTRRSHDRKEFLRDPSTRLESLDGRRFYERVLEGVTEKIGHPEDGVAGMYRIGPHSELVGTRPSERAHPIAAARIDQLDDYAEVDLTTGSVPAEITGELLEDATGTQTVAIAVNGEIGATSAVFSLPDREAAFSAMVPAELFRDGQNVLSIYAVSGSSASPELVPLEVR